MNTPTNIRQRLVSWLPLGWVRHIRRDSGPYLDRYTLLPQGPSGSNPWRVYLHHFMAPDQPGHHNHPSAWSFSLILWGSYTEEVLDWPGCDPNQCGGPPECPYTRVRTRRVRWFNWITADRYHRIAELHPGPGTRGVWTLFIAGPLARDAAGKKRGWGFFKPGVGHVDITAADQK